MSGVRGEGFWNVEAGGYGAWASYKVTSPSGREVSVSEAAARQRSGQAPGELGGHNLASLSLAAIEIAHEKLNVSYYQPNRLVQYEGEWGG